MEFVRSRSEKLAAVIENIEQIRFEDCILDWFQSCFSFGGLTTISYFQNFPPSAINLWSSRQETHSLMESKYLIDIYQIDPFYELHTAQVENGVYRMRDVMPDHFLRSQYYKEYYQFTGVSDEIGMLVKPHKNVTIITSFNRSERGKNQFSKTEVKLINSLFPIYSAVATKHYAHLRAKIKDTKVLAHSALIETLKRKHGFTLSRRQAQVAVLVIKGHSSVSIGTLLDISPHTVKVFRKQIYQRCSISSQAELFHLIWPLWSQDR